MDIFSFDITSIFTLTNLLAIVFGSLAGMLIGAIPGLGGPIALALLLPITYTMSPLASILLLLSAYQSGEYGGSISSVILGIPGSPAAVATTLDGHTYAKKHSAKKALQYSLTASTIGGVFGGLMLIFLSIPIASVALQMSDPEYFLIGILGLIAVSVISSEDIPKSMISVILGLIAGTVGMDTLTGSERFTFGRTELMDGINLITLMVSVFAFSEVFFMIRNNLRNKKENKDIDTKNENQKLTLSEYKRVIRPIGIGSIIGTIIGVLPGLGAGSSSWFAYSLSKKTSKTGDTYGKGNPEGIAAPESANNATVGGALVPLLALGIPGSASIAIVMGAFIIHGIQPGPNIFTQESDLVYGIFYGFILTTIAMFLIGKLFSGAFAKVLSIPSFALIPVILFLSIIGIYSSTLLFFDLWIALVIGIIFFFLKMLDFSVASFTLAFILSPIIEISLRRSLLLSDGDFSIFLTRPYSAGILLFILIIVLIALFSRFSTRRKKKAENLS